MKTGFRKKAAKQVHCYPDDKCRKIYQWLLPPSFGEKHERIWRSRTPGTGKWLITSSAYSSWKAAKTGLLVLHGKLGCGKTYLASSVIIDLRLESGFLVLYHYFDRTKNSACDPIAEFAMSIVGQLSFLLGDIPKDLERLFQAQCELNSPYQGSKVGNMVQRLLDVFHQLARKQEIRVVIDGLDEALESDELEDELSNILRVLVKDQSIPIAATCRSAHQVREDLMEDSTISVALPDNLINLDVQKFISHEFSRNRRLRAWPADLKNEALDTLNHKTQGSFIWASCQMKTLSKCIHRRDIRNKLDTVPTTLEQTYQQVLIGIDVVHRDTVVKILHWLCYAPQRVSDIQL